MRHSQHYAVTARVLIFCLWLGAASAGVAAASGAPAAASPLQRESANSYDALLLALQWPPARTAGHPALAVELGSAMSANLVAPGWSLHGFWPTRFSGRADEDASSPHEPSFCGVSAAEDGSGGGSSALPAMRLPPAILAVLNWAWPDLTPGRLLDARRDSQEQLWQHECAKHGSCYQGSGGSGSSCAAYFLDAVLTAARHNWTEVLASAGIVPSASQPYQVGALRLAITGALGDVLWPGQGLICRPGAANAAGTAGGSLRQLAELRLCVDRHTLRLVQNCSFLFPPVPSQNSCGLDNDWVTWQPLPWHFPFAEAPPATPPLRGHLRDLWLQDAIGLDAMLPASFGAIPVVLLVVGLLGALGALGYWLIQAGPISALFAPAAVTVIHNPLVRQPLQILSEAIDLEVIAAVDPAVAAVAGELSYGMGIKGGIARKMLKILHGKPEAATDDFDIDVVLLSEAGTTPESDSELRKSVTGMRIGHLVLEPKDVEVLSKEGLKSYWIHRDICLNEVLLMRLTPGGPLTLFYSDGALYDARHSVIRSIPHALKSDFTECWCLDGDQPILSPKHVARTILRYFKGHGDSYELGEDTWAYYRRNKLGPITLFQILRFVHSDDDTYKKVVAHLINVGLISGADVRSKGGFNGLWGATLKEVNDRMAQYGGRLSLDELDVDAVERWVMGKKARMRGLPYRQRDLASRTGYIPADEDALSLGLVTFPQQLLDYIEGEGGVWDPGHPEGTPADVAAVRPQQAQQQGQQQGQQAGRQPTAAQPVPPRPAGRPGVQLQLQHPHSLPPSLPRLPSGQLATGFGAGARPVAARGDLEAALGPHPKASVLAPSSGSSRGMLGWLVALPGDVAFSLLGLGRGSEPAGGIAGSGGLQEPLLVTPHTDSAAPGNAGVTRASSPPSGLRRHAMSGLWQGGEEGEVQFIPAQTMVGAAPAVGPNEGRLGMAWIAELHDAGIETYPKVDDKGEGPPGDEAPTEAPRPPSRYSSTETLHFMCRIALAAWPLLLLSASLIVASVGLHLYQLRIQSVILNLATAGDRASFLTHIRQLARVCLAYVAANWLSNVALQLYLRTAMQRLYTGLFQHVLFQEAPFYDAISASELAMRCGVDMMNLRVLTGFLVQKVVKGFTQVVAGVALLATFAGPALGAKYNAVIGTAVLASIAELFLISLAIRARHRVARSGLGRLYGFTFDVFSSIHGVIALALQRTFVESYCILAASYFRSAMILAVWVASHQLFLEAVFSAGVTVALMYIGGSSLLSGTVSVGTVYALIRYTAAVEGGYTSLSEAVARFFASYGSLEHVIDLHQRGQLTNLGKPAVLEYLEREDALKEGRGQAAECDLESSAGGSVASGGGAGRGARSRRLTAAAWAGGVRCRDVLYGYRGRPGHVLFSACLEVPAGGAVLVSGGPGSGRTTLLHLLHLDITAGGGSVQFGGMGGGWLAYHPTSTDRYEMQQRMGYASPQSCIEAVFFASLQENMVCGCTQGRQPSVADCQEAAALTGLDADVAFLPDGYQTLVGEASRVELAAMVRLRLGITRLLLLSSPRLVLIDDADRFYTAVPRLPEVVARLRQAGAAVVLTANAASEAGLRAVLPPDVRPLVLEGGRLRTPV